MVEVGKFIADLLVLFYNLTWLVFLTLKHYGQVTTTAGHIFELNLLLNNTINIFLWIIIEDSGLKDTWCTMSDAINTISSYNMLVAIAGSQIETAIFLKKMNANTMMTNTAAKVILAMTIFAVGMGVISSTMVQPSSRTECHTETFCETFVKLVYRVTIPGLIVFVIVFAVLGFTVFRTHQYKKKRDNNGENDIVTEHIELVTIETHPSSDQVSDGLMIHEIRTENDPILCPPGVGLIIQTLNKYLKNTLMSLLILSAQLPWYLTAMYGHITDSGCDDPTFRFLSEIGEYYYVLMFSILLPLLIKLKLDRLSR